MTDPAMIDLVVIGGGINGAGIARELAGRGCKVVLCEKDDLAAHTSSSSTNSAGMPSATLARRESLESMTSCGT